MKKSKIVIGTDSEGMFSITTEKRQREIDYLKMILRFTFGTGLTEAGMKRLHKLTLILLLAICCSSGLEAANGTLCTATTSKHQPCKMTAQTGSKFCWVHNPDGYCAGITAAGKPCHQHHGKDSKYCRFHQDQAK